MELIKRKVPYKLILSEDGEFDVICGWDYPDDITDLIFNAMEAAGVKDVVSKSLGSNTQINTAKATIKALQNQRNIAHIASLRGKSVEEVLK